jgi:8-oxo-dGTP pyrophosphatase MutT (NUDIX family)
MDRYKVTARRYDIVVEKDKKLLFTRRNNTGWQDGKLMFPGGHAEAGETYRQTAIRELQEEVGLEISADRLEFVCFCDRDCIRYYGAAFNYATCIFLVRLAPGRSRHQYRA